MADLDAPPQPQAVEQSVLMVALAQAARLVRILLAWAVKVRTFALEGPALKQVAVLAVRGVTPVRSAAPVLLAA
jgi:hypothetical protein